MNGTDGDNARALPEYVPELRPSRRQRASEARLHQVTVVDAAAHVSSCHSDC